jgi:hypothetical protein
MTCCGDPLITTTPPLTPPPGADGCLRVQYTCICPGGTDLWSLVPGFPDCVDNAICTGQIACTDTDATIELFNQCVIGDPVPVVPNPAVGGDLVFNIALCPPKCCPIRPPTTTTTTTTTLPPEDECTYQWLASCSLGLWTISNGGAPISIQCTTCTPTDWASVGGDACLMEKYTCGSACTSARDCDSSPAPPDVPVGLPSCCTTTTTPPPDVYCNCVYTSQWNCGTGTWGSISPAGPSYPGNCTEDATNNATPWDYDGLCGARTVVSEVGNCV